MRLCLCLGVAVLAGCGPKAGKGTGAGAVKAAEDPWPAAVAALKKETTAGGLSRVLADASARAAGEARFSPESLSPEAEAGLTGLARLTEDDLRAIRSAGFAPLDGHYLAECLYLRDCVRALELDGLPPAEQARRAFAWVCRQVVPEPWAGAARSGGPVQVYPPVPPTYVLRRGSGSGLERAFVFLGLCQQLGLDGVLVGPADAANKGWAAGDAAPPRGPFTAVGARAGTELVLFDPWAGEPLPADAKPGVPFLSPPLSALAPRLKKVEDGLRPDTGVRLVVDLPAQVKAFADATKTAPQVWNPPDAFSYPRLLGAFIPPADGGASPAPDLITEYRRSQLPPGLIRFTLVPGLLADPGDPTDLGAPDAVQALQLESLGRIAGQFLTDPTPRERVQRGQPDAVRVLVALRDENQKGLERLRTDRERESALRDWVKQARDRSRAIATARDRNPEARAAAEAEFRKFWAETARAWAVLVDLAVAETATAEATFHLALAKHEQAERQQGRADRANSDASRRQAADAWAEARGWWDRYATVAGTLSKAFPGRAGHVKRLADRAVKMTG
jgi:hypothetical protein